MKKVLSLAALLMVASAMLAVPAKRGVVRTLKTTDGKEIRAQLVGDEYAHYYLSADGNCYVLQNGVAVPADRNQLIGQSAARKAQANKARAARRKVGGAGKVYEGIKKGIIILVEYKDVTFAEDHDQALFTRIANEENFSDGDFVGSVSDYFKAQSGGRFELDFDVVGPVTLANKMSYYGGNDRQGNDKHPEEMVVEACNAVDDIVNFADYDWDGDGEVDQVFVLYAGLGEAAGGEEDTVWPHEWMLSEVNKTFKLDGVTINTYACSSELTGYDFDWFGNPTEVGIDGIGTICHEFSHCLGFPDMYDTNYRYYGMSSWDLMDSGSYNGDGFCPAGYTSYEKMVAGWLQPIELTGDMAVTDMKALSEGGDAYIVYNKGHNEEFYMIENRQLTNWDSALPTNGMLILHVDYDETAWYENTVNNNAQQRCTIIPADGKLKMEYVSGSYYVDEEDILGDPYPYNGNNQLTNTSNPKASVYHANTDGKKLMNIAITDITQNDDGTMAFSFTDDVENTPTPQPGEAIFYESFDLCDGTGGNDNLWKGSVASSSFDPDNDGWLSEKAYGANQCARFGTTSQAGHATTPAFTIDGEATLTFMAGAWDGKSDGIVLSLSTTNDAITIDPVAVNMPKGEWGEFTVTLTGTGEMSLDFVADRRFFLDEVRVVGSTNAITDYAVENNAATPSVVYDLQGRRHTSTLGKGLYIVNGRKIVSY